MAERLKKFSNSKQEEYKYQNPYPELYECPHCGALYYGDAIEQ